MTIQARCLWTLYQAWLNLCDSSTTYAHGRRCITGIALEGLYDEANGAFTLLYLISDVYTSFIASSIPLCHVHSCFLWVSKLWWIVLLYHDSGGVYRAIPQRHIQSNSLLPCVWTRGSLGIGLRRCKRGREHTSIPSGLVYEYCNY
jgi:hypothetical protein